MKPRTTPTQNVGQKVTEEWNKFTENIPDVKKEIEDIITSVEEEKDTNSSNQVSGLWGFPNS